MQELFREEEHAPITDHIKKVIKEQSNVEAFQLLELTDKIQCTHCMRYVTSGHAKWQCGRVLVHANQEPVMKDQGAT